MDVTSNAGAVNRTSDATLNIRDKRMPVRQTDRSQDLSAMSFTPLTRHYEKGTASHCVMLHHAVLSGIFGKAFEAVRPVPFNDQTLPKRMWIRQVRG